MPLEKKVSLIAGGCAAVLAILSVLLCGLSALVRAYRELTVPLSLVLGAAAAAVGLVAWFSSRQRR